ncbi:MAG: phosphatase PAP2 family protein [Balneolaceae bacterium]|nr:phosphatase PAP2 family protein [Balneolaceae bacterium]
MTKAQSPGTGYFVERDALFMRSMPDFEDDARYILSSPARFDRKNLLFFGAFSAVTGILMSSVDSPIYNSVRGNDVSKHNFLAGPGRFYDRINPKLFTYGTSGLLVGAGYLLDDTRLARTGWTAAEAVLFTQLTTGILKSAVGRERPYVNDGNFDFDLLDVTEGNTNRSFPSGHTSKIFALSTVLASSYDSPWVRLPSYALAGSVALQRIESSNHWISDVVAGGALGYVMGRALARKNGLVESNSRVYPVIQGGLVGLNIRF